MRAPNAKTLSAALAKAEALTERGVAVQFSASEIRALIYESGKLQGLVHYAGLAPSHAVTPAGIWDVAGYPDVLFRTGAWCARPEGLVFAISIARPNGGWHYDIVTPALPMRPG